MCLKLNFNVSTDAFVIHIKTLETGSGVRLRGDWGGLVNSLELMLVLNNKVFF